LVAVSVIEGDEATSTKTNATANATST